MEKFILILFLDILNIKVVISIYLQKKNFIIKNENKDFIYQIINHNSKNNLFNSNSIQYYNNTNNYPKYIFNEKLSNLSQQSNIIKKNKFKKVLFNKVITVIYC